MLETAMQTLLTESTGASEKARDIWAFCGLSLLSLPPPQAVSRAVRPIRVKCFMVSVPMGETIQL
ncbi:hypothetical protein D3C72_2073460 [compost metagenome]